MTILIVSYTPKEILFVSDTFRYYLKCGVDKAIASHKLEYNHTNYAECVERTEMNCPKIHRITGRTGLICGGDGRFSDVIQKLNTRRNISAQILERLEKKHLNAFWSCHVATVRKGNLELTDIIYDRGNITKRENSKDNISFDSFAPELKDLFFKKYVMPFYLSNTEEKTKVLQEFFSEITELYDGLAGGDIIIAKIDRNGFQWLIRPKGHFHTNTTYSMNWCPEKIETCSATDISWTQESWTTILELASVECEGSMLLFMFAHCDVEVYAQTQSASLRLTLDDVELTETNMDFGIGDWATYGLKSCYSCHAVKIVPKGLHSLKLQLASGTADHTVLGKARRISVLKGFYQGGNT
jgi:hypothetical protein